MDGLLGGPALVLRVDPAVERHGPVLDRHADVARLNAAIPFQPRQHVAPDLVVGRADGFSRACHPGSPFSVPLSCVGTSRYAAGCTSRPQMKIGSRPPTRPGTRRP